MKNVSLLILVFVLVTTVKAQNTLADAEVFATINQAVVNITFTNSGDLMYNHHPFFVPENRVIIMEAKTKESKPFPNKAWNTEHSAISILQVQPKTFVDVLSLEAYAKKLQEEYMATTK